MERMKKQTYDLEERLLEYLTVLENISLPYRISPVLELDATVLERGREIGRASCRERV